MHRSNMAIHVIPAICNNATSINWTLALLPPKLNCTNPKEPAGVDGVDVDVDGIFRTVKWKPKPSLEDPVLLMR